MRGVQIEKCHCHLFAEVNSQLNPPHSGTQRCRPWCTSELSHGRLGRSQPQSRQEEETLTAIANDPAKFLSPPPHQALVHWRGRGQKEKAAISGIAALHDERVRWDQGTGSGFLFPPAAAIEGATSGAPNVLSFSIWGLHRIPSFQLSCHGFQLGKRLTCFRSVPMSRPAKQAGFPTKKDQLVEPKTKKNVRRKKKRVTMGNSIDP